MTHAGIPTNSLLTHITLLDCVFLGLGSLEMHLQRQPHWLCVVGGGGGRSV